MSVLAFLLSSHPAAGSEKGCDSRHCHSSKIAVVHSVKAGFLLGLLGGVFASPSADTLAADFF